MSAYYNEIEPYCCQWLRNLMAAGLIPDGEVDSRSITEVQPEHVKGFTQCHFFAGLGGWAYAARLAGWPDDRHLWTGSCPCQPFSVIGKRAAFQDERHLWPEWFRLIRKSRPPVVFGEQVANALSWLDLVFADMEAEKYACAAFDLPAASVGARHTRQRLWFVADSDQKRWSDPKGKSAPEARATFRPTPGMVHCATPRSIRGTFEPSKDWVIDGVRGGGNAVRALGNSIVPQVAAEVLMAWMDGDQPRRLRTSTGLDLGEKSTFEAATSRSSW